MSLSAKRIIGAVSIMTGIALLVSTDNAYLNIVALLLMILPAASGVYMHK